MNVHQIAIPRYTREAYAEICKLMPPAETRNGNPISYEELLSEIENIKNGILKSGNIPREIDIEPIPLKRWCDAEHVPVCRESIRNYQMICMGKQLLKTDSN